MDLRLFTVSVGNIQYAGLKQSRCVKEEKNIAKKKDTYSIKPICKSDHPS